MPYLFRLNKASRGQTLLRLRISSGLALTGAVMAQFLAGTGGNGLAEPAEPAEPGAQARVALRGLRQDA